MRPRVRGCYCFFFFQAEDGIRDIGVTGVQTCALPISSPMRMFIDGRPVEASTGEATPVVNPATEEVIAEVPKGTVQDVDRAVEAADREIGRASCRERV